MTLVKLAGKEQVSTRYKIISISKIFLVKSKGKNSPIVLGFDGGWGEYG